MQKTKFTLLLLLMSLGFTSHQGTSPLQPVHAQLEAGLMETIDYSNTHSFLRTKDGKMYTVGKSSFRPMLTTTNEYVTPFNLSTTNRLNFLSGETIEKISVGQDTTIILTESGSVFTSGRTTEGQLGNGTVETYGFDRPVNIKSQFTSMAADDRIIDVVSSPTNPVVNIARSLEGKVWVWGANPHAGDSSYFSTTFPGKSGSGLTDRTAITTPYEITDLFLDKGDATITDIRFTGMSGIAITDQQFMYTWGSNKDGALGQGLADRTVVAPTPVKVDLSAILNQGETITQLSTNARTSSSTVINTAILLTSEARVLMFGANSYNLFSPEQVIGGSEGVLGFVGSPTVVDLTELDLEANETVIQALPLTGIYILTSLGRVFYRGYTSLHSQANFLERDQIDAYLQDAYFKDATQEFPILPEGDFIKQLIGVEDSFGALSNEGRVVITRGGFFFAPSFGFSSGGSAPYLVSLSPGFRYYIYIGTSQTPYADYAYGDTFTLPKQTAPEGFYHNGWGNFEGANPFAGSFSTPESRINYVHTLNRYTHYRLFPVFTEGEDPTVSSSSSSSQVTSESSSQPTTSQPTTSQPTTSQPTTSQPTTSQPTTSNPPVSSEVVSSETPTAPRAVNVAAVVLTTAVVGGLATFSWFFFARGLTIGGFSFIALKAWWFALLKRKKDKDDDQNKKKK